jgi:hypothetical protein
MRKRRGNGLQPARQGVSLEQRVPRLSGKRAAPIKEIGAKYGLADVREANVMKSDSGFKIVDAERG